MAFYCCTSFMFVSVSVCKPIVCCGMKNTPINYSVRFFRLLLFTKLHVNLDCVLVNFIRLIVPSVVCISVAYIVLL